MADIVQIEIEIPKMGCVNVDPDIPEKEEISVDAREKSFIYHEELFHRDLPDQHPISAITGLQQSLNSKQAVISDLQQIRSGAAKGATAVQHNELQDVKLDLEDQLDDEARVRTRMDNQLSDRINRAYDFYVPKTTKINGKELTCNITLNSSEVGALPDSTKYGASISLSINQTTYVMTLQLKDQNGNNLGSPQTVDLPLESVVVSGSYDSTNKKIVLTLQNGNTIDVPVGDLVAGLQTEITAQNKLSADLVDDTNTTNKFVTTQEKTTWNNKQNAINDLDTIRSGASAGASALQPNDNITKLNNNAGYITNAGIFYWGE